MGGAISVVAGDQSNLASEILQRSSLHHDESIKQSIHERFHRLSKGNSMKKALVLNRVVSNRENTTIPLLVKSHDEIDEENNKIFRGMSQEDVEEAVLDKEHIMELLEWVLRLSNDAKRTEEITTIFKNCLDDEPLSFDEFTAMYEEIATRIELESLFEKKWAEIDVGNEGYLKRDNIIMLSDYILMVFASIWCTKREIAQTKKRLLALIDTRSDENADNDEEDERISKMDLFEIYDGMLVTMRMINRTKLMMKTLLKQHEGELGDAEQMKIIEFILKAYRRSGITLDETQKLELKSKIVDEDGQINIQELTNIFETLKANKKWYSALKTLQTNSSGRWLLMLKSVTSKKTDTPNKWQSAVRSVRAKGLISHPQQMTSIPEPTASIRHGKRRLNAHASISHIELETIGITPFVKDQFNKLDQLKKGLLGLAQIKELIRWMYYQKPKDGERIIAEFDNSISANDEQTFDEFCSQFDDVLLHIEVTDLFNNNFFKLSDSKGMMEVSNLEVFIEGVFFSADKLGCTEIGRSHFVSKIVTQTKSILISATVSKMDLSDLFEEIFRTTRLLKQASKPFKSFDKDNDGLLLGDELLALAEWMISFSSSSVHVATKTEILDAKTDVLNRFDKPSQGPDAGLNLGEMALVYDELLINRKLEQNALRYKAQVKNLIGDLLSSPDPDVKMRTAAKRRRSSILTPNIIAIPTEQEPPIDGAS